MILYFVPHCSIVFRIPPSPFSQRELHFLPKPLFLRKQGCNRPLVLGTASLYGWRGIKALAMLCGMGPPYYSLLGGTTIFVPHCSIALHLSSLEWGILFYSTFDRITSGEVPIRGSMFQNGTNFFGFCFLPSLKTKPSSIEITVRTNEPISNLSSVTLRRLSR